MAQQDSDDWKEKYYDSIEQLESKEQQWRQIEEMLRNAIQRLSYAADTRNPSLNQQLAKLREALRNDRDSRLLGGLLEQISSSITALDDMRQSQACVPVPFQALQELLENLNLPLAMRKRVKTLGTMLASGDPSHDVDTLVRDFAALLTEALYWLQEEESSKGGFLKQLFQGKPQRDSADAEAALGQLLEELALPAGLSPRAQRLKQEISNGITTDDLPFVLESLADLIRDARESAQRERLEIQDFLQEITDNLQELDSSLRGAAQGRGEFQAKGDEFSEVMRAQVSHIETSVRDATDLETLKGTIQERLQTIREHMEAYRRVEAEQHKRTEKELERVTARLHAMEVVANILRDRVHAERGQAMRDALTGTYNRQGYDERVANEFARWERYRQPIVLSVWDVDHFKNINDTFGHQAGDRVLKTIAQLFMHQVRATDFVARYGGEEFVVLMTDTDMQGALLVAEKLRRAVEKFNFHYQNERVPITISGGLAEIREGDTPDSLFLRADTAMYFAKGSGRNRYCQESEVE